MINKREVQRIINKEEFLRYVKKEERNSLRNFAKKLENQKIVHFNATPKGGGVAELLESLIPYLRSLGVETEWYSIDSDEVDTSFFEITDKLRDALQSKHELLTEEEWAEYNQVNKKLGNELKKIDADLFIIHDWQVLKAGTLLENENKIYINHPDTSNPYEEVWKKILEMILKYDRYVFSNPTFIHGDFKGNENTEIIRKAIDPLKSKQKVVPQNQAREHLKTFGIPEDGLFILQVSRFDPWKKPEEVVQAFQKIQDSYPQVHLGMVGLQQADDNPEAKRVFEEVSELVREDDRISLFFDAQKYGIKDIGKFTMYAQNRADIIIQNSKKEGFGLTVSEALWKRKPVIGGPASGVKMQIDNGKNGYIVSGVDELADKMKELIDSPKKRRQLGENGRETVLKKFLFPRFVKDHLEIYNYVLS